MSGTCICVHGCSRELFLARGWRKQRPAALCQINGSREPPLFARGVLEAKKKRLFPRARRELDFKYRRARGLIYNELSFAGARFCFFNDLSAVAALFLSWIFCEIIFGSPRGRDGLFFLSPRRVAIDENTFLRISEASERGFIIANHF